MPRPPRKTNAPTPPKRPVIARTQPDSESRLKQAQRAARVIRLLLLLQSRGRFNVQGLAQELACSERTVHRDLTVLREAGVDVFYDDVEGHYGIRGGSRMPTLPLTGEEAIGQAIATALSEAPGLGAIASASPATRKVAASLQGEAFHKLHDTKRMVEVLNLQLVTHPNGRDGVVAIQNALLGGKQLDAVYRTPHEPGPRRLRLHPYRLCFARQAWYLVARIDEEDSPKTFRVARFESLALVNTPSDVPEEFDLREYFGDAWGVYRGTPRCDVRLWFAPETAALVTETEWHRTQTVERHSDGSATLGFTVDGLEEIAGWVLSWTGGVRVLAPEALKELVVSRLEGALELHSLEFDPL
jgi:predicted DNA-binding transcriptional regulator YafY